MTHHLDIVPRRTNKERGIVHRVVHCPHPRPAIISSARLETGLEKVIDLLTRCHFSKGKKTCHRVDVQEM